MELTTPGALQAGRHTRPGFEPRITFDVPDRTWAAVQLYPGFFDIQQDVGSADVIAVQFTTTDTAFGAKLAPKSVMTAAAVVGSLKANPTLEVVETGPTTIGGLAAARITVDTAGPVEARILRAPPGDLSMLPGRRMRLLLVDTRVGILAVILGGSIAEWAKAERAAQPVLDSITIDERA